MANILENYGLEFFAENEEAYVNFVNYLLANGKQIYGYYGDPYFFTPVGDSEFWIDTKINEEDKNIEIESIHSHCCGHSIWTMEYLGTDLTPKDASNLNRVGLFRSRNFDGIIPIEVITADVLPSFCQGDEMDIQLIAMPLTINYYANEDEFVAALPEDENGKKWMVGEGSLIPVSFLYNHSVQNYKPDEEYDSDVYVEFRATVSELYNGVFELGEEKYRSFIRCIADTVHGKLDFIHSLDQVPEELRDNIEVGAVISGTCILQGDVALKKYENGIVRDFEHNLKLMRYTLAGGDPERLRTVLSDDVLYETDTSGKTFIGARAIIDKIAGVHKKRETKYIAHFATITAVDGDDNGYPVGTRCIVIESEEEDDDGLESIAFISVNDEGMITKIKISMDSRYYFRIDEAYENIVSDDECDTEEYFEKKEQSKKNCIELCKIMIRKRFPQNLILTALDLLMVIPMPEKMEVTSKFLKWAESDMTESEFRTAISNEYSRVINV